LIKQALEDEFSGFVDVFVSSDGVSIPAGSNFLKRIEDGLVKCVGAIYLISPVSIRRNWISFELGAVWVRNVINLREGDAGIPTLPVCLSGMSPSGLPAPLNNLNGISANRVSELQFAFRSIQSAVGGRGVLKTDFDTLAAKIIDFEQSYILGASVSKMLAILGGDTSILIQQCEQHPPGARVNIDCGFVENSTIQTIKALEANELKGYIKSTIEMPGVSFGTDSAVNGARLKIDISVALLLRFKEQILK
jgi:hypothetical protein